MEVRQNKMISRSQEITFIEVVNDIGFKIVLSTLGAGIYEIYYRRILTITPLNKEEYLWSSSYYGKTIGRVCGRIRNGVYHVGNVDYQVECNENRNCLHGGSKGWAFQNFDYEIERQEQHTLIIFSYLAKDKENGFNGNLKVKVTYIISRQEPEFTILYEIMSDQNTICNVTNHTYFTLDGDSNSLANQSLMIPADYYIMKDEELINTKAIEVDGFMDFRKEKAFTHIDNGHCYDHDYILNSSIDGPSLIMACPTQKCALRLYTDFPVIHIYSANEANDISLLSGVKNTAFNALAIECARNDLDSIALRAFKEEKFYIKYHFVDL